MAAALAPRVAAILRAQADAEEEDAGGLAMLESMGYKLGPAPPGSIGGNGVGSRSKRKR